jgi:SAM-dependent methyltransferase
MPSPSCRPTAPGDVQVTDESRARDVVASGYDAIGPRYRDWSAASPVRLRFVDEVMRRLPPSSRVVDLGCGPGEPATRILAERHDVVGVDLSRGQLELARASAPTAALVQADIAALALHPASVDAVVSFYALGHLPTDSHAPLFTAISSWLRPGGLLLPSAPLLAGEGTDPSWLGVPMFFGGIGEEATVAAVAAAGLDLEEAVRVAEDEGGGRVVEFLWVRAVKPGGGEERGGQTNVAAAASPSAASRVR